MGLHPLPSVAPRFHRRMAQIWHKYGRRRIRPSRPERDARRPSSRLPVDEPLDEAQGANGIVEDGFSRLAVFAAPAHDPKVQFSPPLQAQAHRELIGRFLEDFPAGQRESDERRIWRLALRRTTNGLLDKLDDRLAKRLKADQFFFDFAVSVDERRELLRALAVAIERQRAGIFHDGINLKDSQDRFHVVTTARRS